MAIYTPSDSSLLKIAFARLLQIAGLREGTFSSLFTDMLNVTTGPVTLYVTSTGSDSAPGTASQPFLTIQAALNSLPKIIRHLVTIQVGAGSFAGFNWEGFTIDDTYVSGAAAGTDTIANQVGIYIQGTYVASTLDAGTASGTLTGSTTGVAATATYTVTTDSTQAWTVNALKGKLFHVTSSTGIGNMFPITSNTATAITCASTTAVGAASTYSIKDCATIITSSVRSSPSLPTSTAQTVPAGTLSVINFVNNVSSSSNAYFRLEGIKFSPSTASTFTCIGYRGNAHLTIARCQLVTAITAQTLIAASGTGSLFIQQCYLEGVSTGVANSGGATSITNCYIKTVNPIVTFGTAISTTITATQLEVFGGAGAGRAIAIGGKPSAAVIITSTKILGVSSQQLIRCSAADLSGFSVINIAGLTVDATNGTWAFEIFGPHFITATGLFITCASGFSGIALYNGARMKIDATSTITGASEITLDLVATDLATMRAASPKLITNTYGTIIAE